MWSNTFCIGERLSCFPACLLRAWEAHGASMEPGAWPKERLWMVFWEEASRHQLEKTQLELGPAEELHQRDLQLSWTRRNRPWWSSRHGK